MEANDHRVIARRMDLFHLQEEGPGMVFWHPRGFTLYRLIEERVRCRMREAGFAEVRTPQVLAQSLWQASGHLDKFRDAMFLLEDGERAFGLKPMSCPGHVQIFKQRIRSHRDLPLRFCEFGHCLRNEPSGALLGLMRTRAFVQDDAHIFCREDQIGGEVERFLALMDGLYRDFGFAEVEARLATRPELRAGDNRLWDRAEQVLAEVSRQAGLSFETRAGEGAFYGPKLEFHLRDRLGRLWQCGTLQLDFVLPERLGAQFVDAQGLEQRPVILHQALLGSLERFIGMLLEHHAGRLPLWLAPEQVVAASIGQEQEDYAEEARDRLLGLGYRAIADIRPERLAKKIVDAREAGIPILLALGAREAESGQVSLRRPSGEQAVMDLEALDRELRPEAFS